MVYRGECFHVRRPRTDRAHDHLRPSLDVATGSKRARIPPCSAALKRRLYSFLGGVSRSLNISYLRAVTIGRPVYFYCQVVQHGRTMAFIKAEMKDEEGRVCATAEHHKVNVPAQEAHMRVRVPFDDVLDREEADRKGAKL